MTTATDQIVETETIASVWAGHSVGFHAATRGPYLYVGFYDDQRRMTLGRQPIEGGAWTFHRPVGVPRERDGRLSTTVGWDSHNYITFAFDRDDHLHLSGNLHCDPLVYFRGTRPLAIEPLERLDRMTGQLEQRATYPVFMTRGDGTLVFRYRDGGSGNGNDYYNVYDTDNRTWRRLLDTPLHDGQGQANAYAGPPRLGPDGLYHMGWVWRQTPDAASNFDLSYARSADLVTWTDTTGRAFELPLRVDRSQVVDPVPAYAGLSNMSQRVGFDAAGTPTITYHKYDEHGRSQLYTARDEDGRWVVHQMTEWPDRWDFSGSGSIPASIRHGSVEWDGALLTIDIEHFSQGEGRYEVDPATLQLKRLLTREVAPLPGELMRPRTSPEYRVHTRVIRSPALPAGEHLVMRWETLPPHRDQVRDDMPPPSNLELLTMRAVERAAE